MRAITAVTMAALVLPVAGRLAAGTNSAHVIPFSPARDQLRIRLAASPWGASFEDMAAKDRPTVAINGTYYGRDGRPLGLLRSGGRWVFRNGRMRTVFAVDRDGRAAVITRDAVRRAPERYPFALGAGPRLLKGGALALNPEAEGFRPASRRIRASRVALGVRRDGSGVIIVESSPVTLGAFAQTCRKAGAVDAVNLDGGGATALYSQGRTLVSPRLPMVNVVTLHRR